METKQLEQQNNNHTVRNIFSKLSLVGLCLLPVADFAGSDAGIAKLYHTLEQNVPNDGLPGSLELDGLIGSTIVIESLGLSLLVGRNNNLKNGYDSLGQYLQAKQASMSPARKAISKGLNSPISLIEKVGGLIEKTGEKAEMSKISVFRSAGPLLIDTGKVNAAGTCGVAFDETMRGNPPSMSRQIRLAGLMGLSWLAVANGTQELYRSNKASRIPLAAIGAGFNTLTTINFQHPASTPLGVTAIGLAAGLCAKTGWNIQQWKEDQNNNVSSLVASPIAETAALINEA